MNEKLLDVRGVADRLNVSVRTVERIIAERKLRPIWIRGRRRFNCDAVDAFVRSCPGGRTNLRRKEHGGGRRR